MGWWYGIKWNKFTLKDPPTEKDSSIEWVGRIQKCWECAEYNENIERKLCLSTDINSHVTPNAEYS